MRKPQNASELLIFATCVDDTEHVTSGWHRMLPGTSATDTDLFLAHSLHSNFRTFASDKPSMLLNQRLIRGHRNPNVDLYTGLCCSEFSRVSNTLLCEAWEFRSAKRAALNSRYRTTDFGKISIIDRSKGLQALYSINCLTIRVIIS